VKILTTTDLIQTTPMGAAAMDLPADWAGTIVDLLDMETSAR
jgi:hypothetical protein